MRVIITNVPETEKVDFFMYWLEKGQTFRTPHKDLVREGKNLIMNFNKEFPGRYELLVKKDKEEIKEYLYIIVVGSTNIQMKTKIVNFEVKKEDGENKIFPYDSKKFNKEKIEHRKKILMSNTKHWNTYWLNIHWLCQNYPEKPTEEEQKQIHELITVMRTPQGLQCPRCRGHFDKYVKENDPAEAIKDQEGLFKYFWEVHNDVNKNNKKKQMSLEDAVTLYSIKDWGTFLKKYGGDILEFFKKGELNKFPLEFNSKGRQIMRQEFFNN